ncbi:ATPase [Candidatus Poribacteria bacterium]|nr:ATPase [Candidatus Poribacteria bacterium]
MKFLMSLIRWMKMSNVAIVTISILAVITVFMWITLFGTTENAVAQEENGEQISESHESKGSSKSYMGLGFLAAAISTGVSAIAAGVAVSIVGSAAMGAVAEKPEIMGRSIIFVGLAEGIAIYGLIISIMILGKL